MWLFSIWLSITWASVPASVVVVFLIFIVSDIPCGPVGPIFPLGILKFKITFSFVPEFTTLALVSGSVVVVVPIVIVVGPWGPVGPVGPIITGVQLQISFKHLFYNYKNKY